MSESNMDEKTRRNTSFSRKSILFKTRLIFESDESPGESFGDSKHEIKGSDQIWYFAPIFLSDSIAKTLSVWLWHYILPTQGW